MWVRRKRGRHIALFVGSAFLAATFAVPAYAQMDKVGDTGFYVELGGSLSSVSDVDAPFTSDNSNGKYGTEDAFGGKVQLGWDFGKIRADIKVTAHESGAMSRPMLKSAR